MKTVNPLYASSIFSWCKNHGSCKELHGTKFTTRFRVISVKTFVTIQFEEIHDEDGYDGEFRYFKSVCGKYTIAFLNC